MEESGRGCFAGLDRLQVDSEDVAKFESGIGPCKVQWLVQWVGSRSLYKGV